MAPAISVRGVVKRFGRITAVDGFDLEVPAGSCVGLLGPNGAGKSTTMKLLTAQSIADEGELEVLGYRLPAESKQARAECGVVPQLDNLDTTLTVEHRNGGQHFVFLTGQHHKHGARIGFVHRFAENFPVEHHGGVGAQHAKIGVGHDHAAPGLGFAARQALDISRRGFLI